MPYEPNADDLMSDREFDEEYRRVRAEIEAANKLLHPKADGRMLMGEDRDAVTRYLADLEERRHKLNAAQGRRTFKRANGRWPDLD
jgi:hypothetical protein